MLREGKGLRNGIIDWEKTFTLRWWVTIVGEAAALSINMPLRYCHLRLSLYYNTLVMSYIT